MHASMQTAIITIPFREEYGDELLASFRERSTAERGRFRQARSH